MLEWLLSSDAPLLYLTGPSGSGKSSLLAAYVLPRLRDGTPPVQSVVVRSFRDPIEDLRNALLEPGRFWQEPCEETIRMSTPDLLAAACGQTASNRLLVVLDQFEELLIIQEQANTRVDATRDLLGSLVSKPIPGVTLLLSFRNDYEGNLDQLNLPLFDQSNHRPVGAFSLTHARDFVRRSGNVPENMLNDVLAEAAEIEETPGLIRPIVLNLFGLAIIDPATPMPARGQPGARQLLTAYLRTCVSDAGVRDHARPILFNRVAPMITDKATKYPQTISSLAKATGFKPHVVAGCLVWLSEKGLVRCVDLTSNLWEVSHDFVARLLGQILAGWREALIRRVRPFILPVVLAL